MLTVTPNLSLNLSQLLQKAVHLNDLQYDYFAKFLAAACRSQTGPEVVVLSKEAGNHLTPLSTIPTEFEPIFLSWAPPTFGNMLVVVSSDNSVTYYRNDQNCGGVWKVVYRSNELCKSVSSLSVGVSNDGELLVALGSLTGAVTIVTSHTRFETSTFKAHTGGVYSLAFNSVDGSKSALFSEVLLATAGIDGTVKVWQLFDPSTAHPNSDKDNTTGNDRPSFRLVEKFDLEPNPTSLLRVNSLCWSKQGLLAAATESNVYLFEKTHDWHLFQTLNLPQHGVMAFVAFNNDRIVLLQDTESVVFKRNDSGTFEFFGNLSD
ncbi:transport protein (SEC13 homologue), putative [Theileria annulata]|uniref:Transport protein (SEC13 homologue), putative n=1 Tax=Theileria annulata TaxID=5874 RepID=Q4UD16_THEAN|nr:transport protein (SEC13 homologue), putative [Theileria annulata]CAI75285.1 transport protein (SEC13 homologue), putative [Theileria annulata]|eukprot:XP_954761.1 transport protein (SEC13 homologue), putative [Theileria annulata]